MTTSDGAERHPAVPSGLRYALRTRLQWPEAVFTFLPPGLLLTVSLGPSLTGSYRHVTGSLFLCCGLGWAFLALTLVWRRRGIGFGFDGRGVWLRTPAVGRGTTLVTWRRLDSIVLSPQYYYREFRGWRPVMVGVYITVCHDGDVTPRRPWLLPCDASDYHNLVSELSLGGHPFVERTDWAKAYLTRMLITVGGILGVFLTVFWLASVLDRGPGG